MILTIVLTTLATCGLLLILWTLTAAILLPKQPANALYVLPLRGGAAQAEQAVRAALRLRERSGLCARLIFLDDGLDVEAQIAVSLLLRKMDDAVLCTATQLPEFIRTENDNLGAGAD